MSRSGPFITYGMIVLNGMPFLPYNLRTLYPFAGRIVVVEGAAPGAAPLLPSRTLRRGDPVARTNL
jgi:hypothetical protein